MSLFDISSLSLLTLFSNLLLVVAMLLVGRIERHRAAARYCIGGASQVAAGFLLVALRHQLPGLFSIVLANTLIATGFAWLVFGHRLWLGLPRGPRWDIAAGVLVATTFAYFTWSSPDLAARIVVLSVVLGSFSLYAAWLLLLSPEARQDADRSVIVVLGLSWLAAALVSAVRAVQTMLVPPGEDFMFVTEVIQKLAFVATMQLNFALIYCLSFLSAKRTLRALRASEANLIEDIEARKTAEAALRRAIVFDEAALKCLGEGLYTIDTQGLVTSMNPAAEALFGWSFAELRGKKMHDMTHHHYPDGRDFPSSECAGFQVLTTGQPLTSYEDVFIRKDGSFFNVAYTIAPLRDDSGRIEGLVVVFSDITQRKQADAERAAMNALVLEEHKQARLAMLSMMEDAEAARERAEATALELSEREARTRAIIESTSDGFLMVDAQGRIQAANDAYARLSGYSNEALLDMYISDLEANESAEDTRAHIGKVMQMGASVFETWHRARDGRIWPVEVAVSYRAEAGGHLFSFLRDISDRKVAEAEFKARNEELERFNRATVGRELDMIELKREVNALARELGREPPHDLSFLNEVDA